MENSGVTLASSRRVNYGWLEESLHFVTQEFSLWIVAQIIYTAIESVAFAAPVLGDMIFRGAGPTGMIPAHYSPPTRVMSQHEFTIVIDAACLAVACFQASSFSRMALKQVCGEPITLGDAFSGASRYWATLAVILLAALLGTVGILGFVAGMFGVIGLAMPALALAADGESAPRAIARSFRAMKADWVNAGVFSLMFAGILSLSVAICFLGSLLLIPMGALISALAYRDMIGIPPRTPTRDERFLLAGVWPPPPC